ncbi:MAG: peptidase M22 [Clostridia bacterium]|nr:peptidase M22 [Clostridia bacterium]
MKTDCFIGIDTSNYTTSLAFCDGEGRIVANLKCPLPVKEGARGLRQSDAVFLHTQNIPTLFKMAEPYFATYRPVAVGVSSVPRRQEGSYMPCFLSGKAVATALSVALGVPLFEFSHQNGHIMAAYYASGAPSSVAEGEFLAFHVSGGTTEVLLVRPDGDDFWCEIVGGTADMNAGQAVDRVGVAMGLSFPCGPEMERLALRCEDRRIPKMKPCVKNGTCNLSGLENKAVKLFSETGDKEKTARFVLEHIAETLALMTEQVRERYPSLPVIYGGGVMSCSILQKRLRGRDVYFAEPSFSSDNAAGIALLTKRRFQNR